jgi:5-methyltetrahydropteroyltriglutamate--homocysteine methyltransferase
MPPQFRADHVGSLLRPSVILQARADPSTSRNALTRLEDEAILAALERQRAAGLEIFTDGEFRRAGFMSDFYESVDGLSREGEVQRAWTGASSRIGGTSGIAKGGAAGIAVGKIRQTKPLTSSELDFLLLHAPGAVKVTLPSANQFPAIAYT